MVSSLRIAAEVSSQEDSIPRITNGFCFNFVKFVLKLMAKILKIIGRLIGISLEWVLLLLIVFAFSIRTSQFQTFLGTTVTNYLTEELNAEFHIGKIDIVFFDKVYLKDVFVRDQHGDTLASLNQIKLRIKSLDLTGNHLDFKSLALYQGRVGIERDTLSGDYNFKFIVDYFKNPNKIKKKKKTPLITVDNIAVEFVTISYDDYRKPLASYGIDFAHMTFNNIILHASRFKMQDRLMSFKVNSLQTNEKSGFWLKKLTTNAIIHPSKGVLLSNLAINSSRSTIYSSKLNMLMSSLKGFSSFVDSVAFDAVIDSSRVSMWDVSQFAHALEGMRDMVSLKATVTNKVKELRIKDLDLRFGTRSVVRGTYSLPDFRSMSESSFDEQVEYALIDFTDLQALVLPKKSAVRKVRLSEMIDRLQFAEIRHTRMYGSVNQFQVKSDKIQTDLGTVKLANTITLNQLPEGGYSFNRTDEERYDILIDSFNLGKFLGNPNFGKTSGEVYLSGIVGQKDLIRLETVAGNISYFQFNEYPYSNIKIRNGAFIQKVLTANVLVNDPNLSLTFDGSIDVSKKQQFDFEVAVERANLGQLHFMKDPETFFVGDLEVDISGNSVQTYEGIIYAHSLELRNEGKELTIPELSLYIERNEKLDDRFELRSVILDADLVGKFDFNTIGTTINNGLADAFPSYFSLKEFPKKAKPNDRFMIDATVKNASEFLNIFVPKLHIASGTTLNLELDAARYYQNLDIKSPEIKYDQLMDSKSHAYIRNLHVQQDFINGSGTLTLTGDKTQLRDSLEIENIHLSMNGTKNVYITDLIWNKDVPNTSDFNFIVDVREKGEFDIQLKPSYFSVKNKEWDIMNTARLTYCDQFLEISHLMLERDNQFLSVNGLVSNDPEHYLVVNANELQIDEFSSLLGVPIKMEGKLNGRARISTPFSDVKVDGDVTLNDFYLKGNEVGDVHLDGIWLDLEKKIILNGDLKYKKLETFDFSGYVLPFEKEDNINFDLEFKDMDISFANAFVPLDVISDVSGRLKGVIKATGSFNEPIISGNMALKNAGLKVGILGTHYRLNGPLKFDGENDGIYGSFPILDDDGNVGYANTTVFHNNFKDFSLSFELLFDETVAYFRDPFTFKPLSAPSKFMVLNTSYKEGTVYYGKAYATGNANIFIEKGNTEIIVNAKTEKGTHVDLPLYGAKEISEFDFIDFSKDTIITQKKLDLTGVDLKLNIKATPDANLKLILNDKTNEEIKANGSGDISMEVDNFGQLKMSGQYIINSGTYDFVFNPIKKLFTIDQGSSIVWTGSPFDANLDIKAYYKVNASLNELNKDQIGGASDAKSEVRCVLLVGQTLSSPSLKLDIEVPNVNESGKAVLEKIRSDNDELQKQFFTLLALNRFQGTANNGLGGMADILTQQINSALDQLSKDVKLNVDYKDNGATGNKNYQFGIQRAFGEKQNIVIRTSFGVANNTSSGTSTNSLIGNFNLDYLINDDGSFRISIFNESNDRSILSNKEKGDFTQGVGLHYEEAFNSLSESRIIEFFANIFRKKNKVNNSKRKNRVPVDYIPGQSNATLPEKEEDMKK